ncbi:60S acidic ribosomal protein P2A-like [Hibiscus syriacus]|uniref:60S acidic ribosomal protein P2A-like n=1 Tax=Hibiscus syriacus TaxID=106335 RepID=UPI0019215335|nr:60S acidic ribosomal protein P2A-like [Hibiscus syriacus]
MEFGKLGIKTNGEGEMYLPGEDRARGSIGGGPASISSPGRDALPVRGPIPEKRITSERLQLLLSEVKGKDITELIASGKEKLASVPCGGGGVVVAAAAPGAAVSAAPAAAETKKEEKAEEKEESDDDVGFSLFD